jgi:N-acetylglucosaminyldiphosphoundecaprenol N-acetyl-beta-D-mannosaminyltransferase
MTPMVPLDTNTSILVLALPATSPLGWQAEPCAPPPLVLPWVQVWGLRLARVSFAETVDAVDRLIARRKPSFFITANLHYAMLCDRDPGLCEVNRRAAFLVADGMPLVWYARLTGRRLPERVTGADLVWHLCARAAVAGHRVFLLGGAPGVAQEAGRILARRYPGLQIAGTLSPPHRRWTDDDNRAIVASVRRARADLLIAALGQPKGELWLAAQAEALGVPACVQVGASLDFIVGRSRRAPTWLQRSGLEWLFRMLQEPRRLGPRYLSDALFLAKAIARDLWPRRP